jgi:hypothetical protein
MQDTTIGCEARTLSPAAVTLAAILRGNQADAGSMACMKFKPSPPSPLPPRSAPRPRVHLRNAQSSRPDLPTHPNETQHRIHNGYMARVESNRDGRRRQTLSAAAAAAAI